MTRSLDFMNAEAQQAIAANNSDYEPKVVAFCCT